MKYAGTELELFAHALRWKRYWATRVQPLIKGDVLEVGSGLGANIHYLHHKQLRSWTALEPDGALLDHSRELCADLPVQFVHGDLGAIRRSPAYDTILYVDVLEHIEHDHAELIEAVARLRTEGHLIILVPAFMFLYSPFDAAIGHFRRYTRTSLRRVIPSALAEVRMDYLDAAGLALSLSNRMFLHSREPTIRQVLFWDRFFVPVSRVLDRLVAYSCGRSLLGVWTLQ